MLPPDAPSTTGSASVLSQKFASQRNCHPERSLTGFWAKRTRQTGSKDLWLFCSEFPIRHTRSLLKNRFVAGTDPIPWATRLTGTHPVAPRSAPRRVLPAFTESISPAYFLYAVSENAIASLCMRNDRYCILVCTALLFALPAAAQSADFHFKPGEWRIDSTVTPSVGHPVTSRQRVCARQTSDLYNQQRPNQQCSPPAVSSAPGGVRVQLTCQGGAGPAQWKMVADVQEIFSADGTSFKATGHTTTTTTLPGQSPMTVSGDMKSEGVYQGACSSGG